MGYREDAKQIIDEIPECGMERILPFLQGIKVGLEIEKERERNNASFLEKLERGRRQIESGSLQYHELIEVDA